MNHADKETAVHRFCYEIHDRLRAHLATLVCAYNFARHLWTLKRPNSLRTHWNSLAKRAETLYKKSASSFSGTKQIFKEGIQH
jgi:hypothetical protein